MSNGLYQVKMFQFLARGLVMCRVAKSRVRFGFEFLFFFSGSVRFEPSILFSGSSRFGFHLSGFGFS